MTGLSQHARQTATDELRFVYDGWVNDLFNLQPSTSCVSFDGNGNVVALFDAANGSETARYEYGLFGEVIRATGDGLEYMVGNEPPGMGCVVKYSCAQKCNCCGTKFTATYEGTFNGMKGQTGAKYARQRPVGEWEYEGSSCVVGEDQKKKAEADCKANSHGQCDRTITIKAH